MRVYRGRAGTIDADRAVSEQLADTVATDCESAVRVWRPHRQVVFGRRDANEDRYERARQIAEKQGFPPVEREVGGRAVAYTGSTVAFARVTAIDNPRSGLQDRYDAAITDLQVALATLGVDASEGEPPHSFCPGTHSIQADCGGSPGKIVGLAQRVRKQVAIVAGVLLVRDRETVAAVLVPVYDALDVEFDPETVGSVEGAGGDSDPGNVVEAVEDALVGDESVTVERVADGA